MGRKCGVEGCLSDSGRPQDVGVTFHKVPMHNDIRPKWISLCRIPEDKKGMKVIYICSRHFLRKDFCNFRGTKYMLKQGVLPSVFPWDKSKLERIKSVKKEPDTSVEKMEIEPAVASTSEDFDSKPDISGIEVKTEIEIKEEETPVEIKKEPTESPTQEPSHMRPNFGIDSRIEVMDNNNIWFPAQVMEEDYEGNEILIHYDKLANKHDEWINIDSPRLRLPQQECELKQSTSDYAVGERVLAYWSDARKFPATVSKVLANDTYEVIFDDGFVKTLKAHRMCKTEGKPMQASPLFDPVKGSKQERRDKKRKINVAALFGKRQKMEQSQHVRSRSRKRPKAKSQRAKIVEVKEEPPEENPDVFDSWVPQWVDGYPIGIDSQIESSEGTRKSIIVSDPRLPKGWTKHLAKRMHGASAGKWDTVIISPDNRRFRSKSEIKSYLEETKMMKYNWSQFDFSLHRPRMKKEDASRRSTNLKDVKDVIPQESEPIQVKEEQDTLEPPVEEAENKNCLKIPIVDEGYRCPIEGCGKTYRRENLAQMHVKHYHPEYTKFLDSTPNVADLAYARTVGESFMSLDRSPISVKTSVSKASPKHVIPRSSTFTSVTKSPEASTPEPKPSSPAPPKKDSEIIRLLNSKPDCEVNPLPSGLPSNMYPEINLKDLLTKSEGIPPHDEMTLRALSSTRPTGIKTILPVIRSTECGGIKTNLKRNKKGYLEQLDSPKGNLTTDCNVSTIFNPSQESEIPNESKPNNVIIEGGKVIKIVRMKQEEIINCTCGYPEEDGLMIQCDLCLCWQHAFCNNIFTESQVPEKYICYICQNPVKQRLSKKYFHDQDWLKYGTLPVASFHTRDDEMLAKRFDRLRKSHDITGGFYELREFANNVKFKLKIAEAKNHPKLYLWSKPWNKNILPEKIKEEPEEKYEEDIKPEESPMLLSILKGHKEEFNKGPKIPEPEAAIESADCRLNLLEHINHAQSLMEERLDAFEKQIENLDDESSYETDENFPKTRQTINMLLKDLSTLQELSQLTTL